MTTTDMQAQTTPPTTHQRVTCPTCGARYAEPCATSSGRPVRQPHTARWEQYRREMREYPSRWLLLDDDERFGLTSGDVLIGRPYWLDPDKVTVDFRESDGVDPECNQYRVNLRWTGWAER
jgi:hypothetical protein